MPPYQNFTYFRETGRAVSMKPPMPRQVLQLPLAYYPNLVIPTILLMNRTSPTHDFVVNYAA